MRLSFFCHDVAASAGPAADGKLRQKCHSYFPDQLQSEEAYGQLSVTVTEKEDIDGDITKRSLSLKHR